MKYAYENLSDKQFEELVILICQKLLGIGVQGFSDGTDGGRDAKFVGTAEIFPSTVAPWMGTIIIQAKHTNGLNRSFSETDFYSDDSKTTIIAKEVPRIKALRDAGELDHYMLFSNRRLSGNAESIIRKHISTQCGVPEKSISLTGIEQIELWLKAFADIPAQANIDPIDFPLNVGPGELAEIVEALAKTVEKSSSVIYDPPTARITYEDKNRINNMSGDYAKELRRMYLKDTSAIKRFLADPTNVDLLQAYESVTQEFQLKIIAKRKHYQSFDDVMNYLMEMLFVRDAVLSQRRHKRITRAVLFYMYWNCDIGQEHNA